MKLNLRRVCVSVRNKKKKKVTIDLIFFFKAESSGKETSVICVCLYIRYASSLLKKKK